MTHQFDPDAYLNAGDLAAYLGCADAAVLDREREAGHVPAPDTVFGTQPLWSPETAKQIYVAWMNAYQKARGSKHMITDAPDPLTHSDVVMLRVMQGRRWDTPKKPFDPSKGTWGYIVGSEVDQSEDGNK